MLIGTTFFLHAAPAWAEDECGPPPPPGEPVICEAGEYPNGIDLFVVGGSEVRLEPGFVSQNTSQVDGVLEVRLIGPVDTLFNYTQNDIAGSIALFVGSSGQTFVNIDDVNATGQRAGGVSISGRGSATFIADTVASSGHNAIFVAEQPFLPFFPPQLITGAEVRVNSVITTGDNASGMIVSSQQSGSTIDSGAVTTNGNNSTGIRASGQFVTIRSGSVATGGGASPGIVATSLGEVSIASTSVATQGADSPGILATAGAGNAVITAGSVSVAGSGSNAIDVTAPGTSTVSIGGMVQSAQGLAVRASGGPATVNILGGGTLRGRVSLTGGADRIGNNGIFDAIGTSQFGAGADVFDNNAGATLRSVNGAAAFAGLEAFSNRGTIDLRDGSAGDSLTLGSYNGAGAALLGLDVDFGTGAADRLVTGAATGSTQIVIQGDAGGFTSGILLVDAGAGTSATAFTLADGSDSPYLRNSLSFDAANNDFLLVRLPGQAVFETARFGAMANQLWYESADAVAAQLDAVRDGQRGRGIALWVQGWTGERERSGTQTVPGAGTFDVSYEQDFQGLQGGLDFQTGAVAVGITAGAGRSDATFLASGSPVDMEVRNIGAYVQGQSGLLYFNALAKFDRAELEIAPGAGLGASFDADSFGVQANAGVRLGFGSVFAEPSVGLSWVQTEVDAFASGPATIGPGEGESLRARAGLRVGARLPLGGGALLPFAAVNAYEELEGRNSSDFTLGETLRLLDEPPGTRGQAAAGVSFVAGSFEAFVRGDMDFSGESDARSVRAGARLRF